MRKEAISDVKFVGKVLRRRKRYVFIQVFIQGKNLASAPSATPDLRSMHLFTAIFEVTIRITQQYTKRIGSRDRKLALDFAVTAESVVQLCLNTKNT